MRDDNNILILKVVRELQKNEGVLIEKILKSCKVGDEGELILPAWRLEKYKEYSETNFEDLIGWKQRVLEDQAKEIVNVINNSQSNASTYREVSEIGFDLNKMKEKNDSKMKELRNRAYKIAIEKIREKHGNVSTDMYNETTYLNGFIFEFNAYDGNRHFCTHITVDSEEIPYLEK